MEHEPRHLFLSSGNQADPPCPSSHAYGILWATHMNQWNHLSRRDNRPRSTCTATHANCIPSAQAEHFPLQWNQGGRLSGKLPIPDIHHSAIVECRNTLSQFIKANCSSVNVVGPMTVSSQLNLDHLNRTSEVFWGMVIVRWMARRLKWVPKRLTRVSWTS